MNDVLPAEMFKYFWDVDPRKVSLRRHGRYIVERVLEFGDLKARWWLQKRYSSAFITEVYLTSRKLSQRRSNRHFWMNWFGDEGSAYIKPRPHLISQGRQQPMSVKAVELVRKIRDQYYEETKGLSVAEQIKFVRRKSENLQRKLKPHRSAGALSLSSC